MIVKIQLEKIDNGVYVKITEKDCNQYKITKACFPRFIDAATYIYRFSKTGDVK